ncbi:uncharacterized protein LOC121290137 isoform X2 [Carcharodon carcharias]|uniref:uncharacterized protein LOC121290137 isoform X2 n=1 Tax=Carcharodon carcharias TaxID=13397 RepID=UPI001B7EE9BB|nr:uncharacterized protein LOC121290137 isoform X2 [Carcharodon carcharias]
MTANMNMDRNRGLTWMENCNNEFPSPLDSRPSFGRKPKVDLDTKSPDVAMKHCRLAVCQKKQVILKSQNCAASAWLNGKSVSDGNLVKQCDITVFNGAVRLENQDLETHASLPTKDATAQENLALEEHLPKKARRNAPGKRKSRDDPLGEMTIASVKNPYRSTKQLFCRQLLQASNRLHVPLTSQEKKTLQINKLVKCWSRAQEMSIHQEDSDEARENATVDRPITAFELDLQPEDLTQIDGLPWRPVARESKGQTIQSIGRGGEGRALFLATPGDCAPCSKFVGESITNKQEDRQMQVDKDQANAAVSITAKTPSTPLASSMSSENQLGVAADMFHLKSAENFCTQRKRFSRRASSVGARGSPETNSLIRYIAKQRMQPQEPQKAALLKTKMAGFMDTFQASEQNERKMSIPELMHLSDLQQAGATPAVHHDYILPLSDSKLPVKKKVTFGGELSPEVFDKSLPSNTPLRKGGTPVCQKIILSEDSPSALKQGFKAQLSLEDTMLTSNKLTDNDSSPVKDHCNNPSLNLLRKLADNMENIGTQHVDEERHCPFQINFDLLSPPSEYTFESNLQKKCNKNNESPCDILEMKVQELKEELLDTISPPGLPGKENEVGIDNVICRTVSSKRTESISKLKLSMIGTESDKGFPTVGDMEPSGMKAAARAEFDAQQIICMHNEMLKNGDSQVSDREQDSSCILDTCPSIEIVTDKQRNETEDRTVYIESSSIEVSPKSKEGVKTGSREQESTKDELRRSTRNKSKVKNISKNSTTVTKGKFRQKFKKELYGKREYASRKPLLSPIAEVLDIWSESADFLDNDGKLECAPSRRISHLCLESTDIGGESQQSMFKSECSAEGQAAKSTVYKSTGKKTHRSRRLRKRSKHYFEEDWSIQKCVKSGTQKGTVGNVRGRRSVPKELNKNLNYDLLSGSNETSNVLCESTEDRACGVKALEGSSDKNLVNDHKPTFMKRKPSKKRGNKHVCEEFSVVENNQQGVTVEQILMEGQCPKETRFEECIKERLLTSDRNYLCSFLELKSNIVEATDVQLQTGPEERKELTSVNKDNIAEESHVKSLEPLIAIPEQKVCILPPGAREVFHSRSQRRNSKLFSAAELACKNQSEQAAAVHVGGHHNIDASSENGDLAENVMQKEGEESLSDKMITKRIVSSHKNYISKVGEIQVKSNSKTLLDNSGHCCSLEQIKTNMVETVDQYEIGIKYSDVFTENSVLEKKKVRRSARLSGFVNMEGLSWIERTSPEQLEETNKSIKLTRKSFRLNEPWGKPDSTEEVGSRTESQSRIRILSRRSLRHNRNIAIDDLEEPPEKSIVLN